MAPDVSGRSLIPCNNVYCYLVRGSADGRFLGECEMGAKCVAPPSARYEPRRPAEDVLHLRARLARRGRYGDHGRRRYRVVLRTVERQVFSQLLRVTREIGVTANAAGFRVWDAWRRGVATLTIGE